jgi:ribonuclease VapC
LILDSSAIVAVVLREPGFESVVRKLSAAEAAFARFGKGRHKAGLNLGDCLSYAVAMLADQPLLCTGGDLAKTDIAVA